MNDRELAWRNYLISLILDYYDKEFNKYFGELKK